jgi:Holliday junction resolvase RusA-like endonuclease
VSEEIVLQVYGKPAPQGSKSAYVRGGRAIVVEGSSKSGRASHAAWRQAVATATRDYLTEHPRPVIQEPVEVLMSFRFAPVASDPHRTAHTQRPDLSKIVRATEDALVDGGLLKDDSCIFSLTASKLYSPLESSGCSILIRLHGSREALNREVSKGCARLAKKQARGRALLTQAD